MNVLVADDDKVSRELLREVLGQWGHNVSECEDGLAAWKILRERAGPELAVLDWMMPGLDGPAVCRRLRGSDGASRPLYLILVTARSRREDIVTGLEAGADDYLTKPVDLDELHARVNVGARVSGLQAALAARIRELEEAQARVKQLQGLLPICSYCKRIRDDKNYWEQVEGYITKHTDARFSHGICPDCYQKIVLPQLAKLGGGGKSEA